MTAVRPIIMTEDRRPWWFVLFTAASLLGVALLIDAAIVGARTGATTWGEVADSFLFAVGGDPIVQSFFLLQLNVVVFAVWYLRRRRG